MADLRTVCPALPVAKHRLFLFLSLLLLLIGCGGEQNGDQDARATGTAGTLEATLPATTTEPPTPQLELILTEDDVQIEPLPLRAGSPFTVTTFIHNNSDLVAEDVPVLVHISAKQEAIDYVSFLQLLTVTLPASQTMPVTMPVHWNFAGGEHRLWIQVNRLPDAWQSDVPLQPEGDTADNIALLDLMVDPFDAYSSDLCSGRVDVEIGPGDILPEPEQQRVLVRVHNVGNRAVYNLPVIVTGEQLSGISYTPTIPPCGGTVELYVELDRQLREGEALTVQVNPAEWVGGLEEDNADNNRVTVTAGLAPGLVMPPDSGLEDYDFSLTTADIEVPEPWTVMFTVHNLGTRDAAMVPIRVENEAGRRLVDAIPLVQGEGMGMAAMRVGYLWTPGGTLTFTVNLKDAKGSYPETKRENNVAIFTLP